MQENETIVDTELEPARRRTGNGWIWIVNALELYRRAFLVWTVIALIVSILFLAAAAIPVVGGMFATLLLPVLLGGIIQTAKRADEGQAPEVLDLFNAFAMSKELFKVGLFYLVAFLVIMLVVGVFMFATIRLGIMPNITPELLKTRGLRALWPFLIMFFSSFAMLYSAYFFAPALVVLRGQSASEAMRLSFLGFWRNWKPILYMGMFGFILLLAGTLPAGLGLLIVVPVLLLTSYTSYSDIYEN